jgi:DtxR family Mn-dependent transcriptional regulator
MDDPIKEFEEMYLKKLYEFYAENPAKPIRNSRIAKEMGVSQASSSEMIQRLAGKGILYHIPYRGSTLTEEGLAAAARIKRRECLMEVFLIRMLDYKGDVKAAACRLEHALTDDLEASIDRLLGYPETTPAGESIPSVSRRIEPIGKSMLLPLHALPDGQSGRVELFILEGTDAKTIAGMGIVLGSEIQSVCDGFSIGGKSLVVAPELSSQILIRTL